MRVQAGNINYGLLFTPFFNRILPDIVLLEIRTRIKTYPAILPALIPADDVLGRNVNVLGFIGP